MSGNTLRDRMRTGFIHKKSDVGLIEKKMREN